MQRHASGNNIIIHGESKMPIGRTMLASIVMKEAFRLRDTHNTISHSYDWVDFSKLMREIEKDVIHNEESDDLIDYNTCDWLVVDNIQKKLRSEKQNTLYTDLLDSFFISRYKSGQPTILVFKFDIRDKHFDFEKVYGTGLSRILESNKTFKIPLSENLLNNNYYE
jgi:DNA replication protein DnaC